MTLPECQQPPVKACSEEAPDGRLCEDVGACGGRIFFFLGSLDARWQEAWQSHETRVASAVAREPAAASSLFTIGLSGNGVLFLRCADVGPMLAVVARSERAPSVPTCVHLPK